MPVENIEQKADRILVIGSIGHPSEVKSYSWKDANKIPNIADYDVVLVDMTRFPYELFQRIDKVINISREKVRMLLESGGTFFVIGPTRFQLENQRECFLDKYFWFSNKNMFQEEEGKTIKDVDQKFIRYFDYVKSWTFVISLPNTIAIAKNRYNKAIAVKSIIQNQGKFYILPQPTEIPTREGINILLEEFCGIKTSEYPEPDWAKPTKVPGVDEIEKNINNFKNKKEEINDKIKNLEKKKKELTKFKKLLFSESYELEQIVRETFRELKADVHDPTEPGKDDGRVITKYGKGVLEIKKRSKSASKEDVRQLDEWVGNCLSEGEEHKGILVLNHYGDKPIDERKEPFPDNVEEYAKTARRQPFCLLTTQELFNAFCAFKAKKLKGEEILRIIFEAEGECKLVNSEDSFEKEK